MPVHNRDVAEVFFRVADLLDIEGANPFRVRAYRNAARTVSGLPREVSAMIAAGEDLTRLAGIGNDLAGKIKRIVDTGSLDLLEDLEKKTSTELAELVKVPGLGPKRVRAVYKELGVDSMERLKEAAKSQKIRELEGFGEKTETSILEAIEGGETTAERIKWVEAEKRAKSLVEYLKALEGVKRVTLAGSFRRRQETVGDLDILVTCKKGCKVIDRFVSYEDVEKVVSKGKTRATVVLRSGLQVDVRVVPQVSYGAALHYFTGSKAHNVALRKRAVKRKLKINEYGVFKGDVRVAGKSETSVYKKVGLPYIEPELREDRGEIEAVENDNLPELVELGNIRGDLHAHTNESDGHDTLEVMAEAARRLGHAYLAITEHSKRVSMAKGLDARRLERQIERIEKLNEGFKDFRLLKGIELDILKDGFLDLPDDILKELDLVVASVHYNRNLSRDQQTGRIIRAMDNPHFNIFAHPTGRLIHTRPSYEVDLDKIMKAALERGVFLELNAHPDRLDLDDRACKRAKDMGLRVAVSTDAHRASDLRFMRIGINQARRGWLEKKDVLNTLTWKQLGNLLKRD